jgi:hypothetical protein
MSQRVVVNACERFELLVSKLKFENFINKRSYGPTFERSSRLQFEQCFLDNVLKAAMILASEAGERCTRRKRNVKKL